MAQKFMHQASVEVDSQGRLASGLLATEAKQDDILAALGGSDGMAPLKTEVVTIPDTSATLKSLLAGAAYQPGVKRVTVKAAGAWSFNIGAAAMGAVTLDGGVLYEIGCTADTDLQVIAGGSVAALVIQEG